MKFSQVHCHVPLLQDCLWFLCQNPDHGTLIDWRRQIRVIYSSAWICSKRCVERQCWMQMMSWEANADGELESVVDIVDSHASLTHWLSAIQIRVQTLSRLGYWRRGCQRRPTPRGADGKQPEMARRRHNGDDQQSIFPRRCCYYYEDLNNWVNLVFFFFWYTLAIGRFVCITLSRTVPKPTSSYTN